MARSGEIRGHFVQAAGTIRSYDAFSAANGGDAFPAERRDDAGG